MMHDVNYEISTLKKSLTKLQLQAQALSRQAKDFAHIAQQSRRSFNQSCMSLSIQGKAIENELQELVRHELPVRLEQIAASIQAKQVADARQYYYEFVTHVLFRKSEAYEDKDSQCLPMLRYLVEHGGNASLLDYFHDTKSSKSVARLIEKAGPELIAELRQNNVGSSSSEKTYTSSSNNKTDNIEIDWGISSEPLLESEAGEANFAIEDDNCAAKETNGIEIDWGDDTPGNDDNVEVDWVETISLEEESSTGQIANAASDQDSNPNKNLHRLNLQELAELRSLLAATVLSTSSTRNLLLNDLLELQHFLGQRLQDREQHAESNAFLLSTLGEEGETNIGDRLLRQESTQTLQSYQRRVVQVIDVLQSNLRFRQLLMIETSPSFVKRTAVSLRQKLQTAAKMDATAKETEHKLDEINQTIQETSQRLESLVTQTKSTQNRVQNAISALFDGRTVHIVGAINNIFAN